MRKPIKVVPIRLLIFSIILLTPLIIASSHAPGLAENAFVNVAVPGLAGAPSHKFVPNEITIRAGGIVNFATVSRATITSTSGPHPISIYKVAEGTKLADIQAQAAAGSLISDKAGKLVLDKSVTVDSGLPGPPRWVDSDPNGLRIFNETIAIPGYGESQSTARTVGVYFPGQGTYLVICRVGGHLTDGMAAIVTVR